MANPIKRGSAPGRKRPEYLRPGSFKPGHAKRGGRERGTPKAFSAYYKRAIVEAAYRIGYDGNGKNGVVGYFRWVARYQPQVFINVGLMSVLRLELEDSRPEQPHSLLERIDQWARDYSGIGCKGQAKRHDVPGQSSPTWDWTGQDCPVGSLMQVAVNNLKAFCGLIAAGFLRPPTKSRALARRRAFRTRGLNQ